MSTVLNHGLAIFPVCVRLHNVTPQELIPSRAEDGTEKWAGFTPLGTPTYLALASRTHTLAPRDE